MALTVKHNFVSSVADGSNAALVRASNWNDVHAITGQVDLATGVSGSLPVSNLNSGASASGTTFWCGNGTWAVPGVGPAAGMGIPAFATPADAQASDVTSSSSTFLSVAGNKTPGDGGAAIYGRVNSLPSPYTGDGSNPSLLPNFTAGHFPINIFSTTFAQHSALNNNTSLPITAGCLTIIVVFDGTVPPPTSGTDTVGNVYLLAAHGDNAGTHPVALYYCANPVFAPVGTTFSFVSGVASLDVYCVQGFTGAVLDQIAVQNTSSAPATGMTISSGTMTTSPELVIGAAHVGMSPVITGPIPGLVYSLSAGWADLSPPKDQRNPIGCIVTASTSPVTFAPTFASNPTYSAVLATFKTFPKPVLDGSFWSLLPSSPLHTAQFGIDPTTPDNIVPFQKFGLYLASTAAPSGETSDRLPPGSYAQPITISIANPAFITLILSQGQHTLSSSQMVSFTTTGVLPAPIVAGQIYFIQYGTVTPTGFSISATSVWGANPNGNTVTKGTPISTLGSTQSGTHNLITYGESWTDFVLDPGVYLASGNQAPGIGAGLKKWRLLGYGARIASNIDFYCGAWNDPNSNTGGSGLGYSAPFQTTISNTSFPSQVTLITPALASNFNVNAWVTLMSLEMIHRAEANWDPSIFEFAKIKSVDPATGIITFWDLLQYNYRSTYPSFPAPVGSIRGVPIGPGTMVQLSEVFDQEIEVHGLNISGRTQQSVGGVLFVRFLDCDIWGFGYKSGPSPTFAKTIKFERCRFHNSIQEVDKSIDLLEYVDCDFDNQSGLLFQSASINKCVLDRCRIPNSFPAFAIEGTPKDMTIRDSFIGRLAIGPALGSTERMTWINSHISVTESVAAQGVILEPADTTFVNGTLKIPAGHSLISTGGVWAGPTDSICPATWAAPGAKVAICAELAASSADRLLPQECMGVMTCFTVLDVYTDGANAFCIDTDLPALPSTNITITGTISGTNLNVTAISPAGAALLAGMVVTGTGLPNGVITGFYNLVGGSGYVNGTYTSVPVTGGHGSGAIWSSITVAGGVVTAAVLGAPGTGYLPFDLVSASTASIGGGVGSGFVRGVSTVNTTTITQSLVGIPNAVNNLGNYTLSNSGGTGTTFTASIPMHYLQHNCPRFTVINCTGGRHVADMAGAPPDIPMFSYFKRAFVGNVLNSNLAEARVRIAGNLLSWTIDVQKPYTGVETTYSCIVYIFGYAVSAGITYPTYISQTVNVKTAGKRTVTAAGTSGGVTGDTLVAVPFWLSGAHNVFIGPPSGAVNVGDTLAKQPRIVITAQTDQGIDFSSMFVYPANISGYDDLADTVTQAILW